MAEARIYDLKREELGKLLEEIDSPKGAELLIPNLQRPFVWQPDQVILLVDSLLRGWPFGTLLLWRVDTTTSQSMIPSRRFWTMVDRTDEKESAEVAERLPPAQYRMVLDGQQRLQSLLLAVGGDAYGFQLFDADWNRIQGQSRPGRRGRYWSRGVLALDLCTFTEEMQKTGNPRDVDYVACLKWVVGDPVDGRSKTSQTKTPKCPIPICAEDRGRYVRLGRLWSLANTQKIARQLQEPVRLLLVEHEVPADTIGRMSLDLAELVDLLGRVKSTDVSLLELQPFQKDDDKKEGYADAEAGYADAVVNIFTRLNTAGRSLTEQEISFAWIKSGWVAAKTEGRQADQCFEDLGNALSEHGIKLPTDDLVRIVSVVWSALRNKGDLLTRRDLLRPEKVKLLTEDLNQRWSLYSESVLWTAEKVASAGLRYREQYESLNALIVLIAWRAIAAEWLDGHRLNVPGRDDFEQKITKRLAPICVRWFAVSQWAGVWITTVRKRFEDLVPKLANLAEEVRNESQLDLAVQKLDDAVQVWLTPWVEAASGWIDDLAVDRREQVSQYFLPLWIWHRLDATRWDGSKLTLRSGNKKISLDVDHVVAADAWKQMIASLAEDLKAEAATVVNQIGNCWLMEKNFNISKSNKSLSSFLKDVHEFVTSEWTVDDWSGPLGITAPLLDPIPAGVVQVRGAIKDRTTAIKDELKAFVRGEKTPVG